MQQVTSNLLEFFPFIVAGENTVIDGFVELDYDVTAYSQKTILPYRRNGRVHIHV
jgi:hypothetical protein